MSKIKNLIKKLCPNGVKYVYLGDIAKLSSGEFVRKDKQVNSGYPVYNGGSTNTGYYSEYNTDENKIIMSARGAAGFVNIIKEKFWAGNSCHIIDVQDNNADWQFVYYCLKNMQKSIIGERAEGTIPSVSQKQLKNIRIPLPPLEIQEEIVKILDKFGELEAELKVELEVELEARKSQYEFWRGELFKDTTNLITIGETCDVLTGGEPPEDTIKGIASDDEHPYPVYGNGKEIYGYSSSYRVDKDSTVISSIGANTGAIYYRQAFFTPIIRLKVVVPKSNNLLPRYLYYALQTSKFKSKSGSVPNLNANDIKSIRFPLVSIEKQNRIVNILDKFEKLINDITVGLPAEIELRRKQYEYYRNKLLSFEELIDE